MKKLKFTSNGVHVGIEDFGFIWKQNDEHEVDTAIAKLAVETFPTLFTIVEKVDDLPVSVSTAKAPNSDVTVDDRKLDTTPRRKRNRG